MNNKELYLHTEFKAITNLLLSASERNTNKKSPSTPKKKQLSKDCTRWITSYNEEVAQVC